MPYQPTATKSEIFNKALDTFTARLKMPSGDMSRLDYYHSRGFYPHEGQQRVVGALEDGATHVYVLAGKRGGKSELVKQEAGYRSVHLGERVWIGGPTYDIVDKILFPLWDEITLMPNVVITERSKEFRRIRFANGGMIEGVSWRVPQQIEAEGVHCLITDESQELSEQDMERFQARLVGDYSWILIGSCDVAGISYYETEALRAMKGLISTWRYVHWPTWLNPNEDVQKTLRIYQEELKELEEKIGKDDPYYKLRKRVYERIYGAVPGQPIDACLPMFDPDIHVRKCDFNDSLPVYLWIDPGFYPASYVILAVQEHPRGTAMGLEPKQESEMWVIDEIYESQRTTKQMIALAKAKPWWKNVDSGAIDIAARQTDNQTGKSEIEVWLEESGKPLVSNFVPVMDGLKTHRQWLADGKLFYDTEKTPNTQAEHRLYRMNANRELPVDRDNHACKAIAYGLVSKFGYTSKAGKKREWRPVLRERRRLWTT